jgi:peptidoglycan biosynthesis protein MviN/MurJ (putative lipid II flippase)
MNQTYITHSAFMHAVTIVSFFASALGLFALYYNEDIRNEDLDQTQWMLFAMTFGYWMMHCTAIAMVRWVPQDWMVVLMGVKLTALGSALLTFSCGLSLPLNQIAEENQTEEV